MEIRRQLTKINQYDIELYEYTKSVYNQRFPVLKSLAEQFKKAPAPIWKLTKLRQTHILDAKRCRIQSVCPIPNVTDSMLNTTGFFRSPGHKLPINATWLDKEGSKL